MKQYLRVFLLAVTSQLMVVQTKDLAITNWYASKTKGSLTDSESVRFGLINNGAEVVTSFTVGFSQDGGQTFKEEVVTQTINANGGQYTHLFKENFAQVGTDGASYTLIGRVVLAGDEVSTNNEITVTIENRIVGDMGDEPILITAFPFTDSKEYALYHDDYMAGFTASNYHQEEDVVYAFSTTETQMYIDAKVHANWSVPAFELPAYTKVWVNGIEQTSGSSPVDFTGDVTHSIEQTINPKTTQWRPLV